LRWVIGERSAEQFCNRAKQRRWIAVRCDNLAANFLAFVQIASIRLWPRVNERRPASRAAGIRKDFIPPIWGSFPQTLPSLD